MWISYFTIFIVVPKPTCLFGSIHDLLVPLTLSCSLVVTTPYSVRVKINLSSNSTALLLCHQIENMTSTWNYKLPLFFTLPVLQFLHILNEDMISYLLIPRVCKTPIYLNGMPSWTYSLPHCPRITVRQLSALACLVLQSFVKLSWLLLTTVSMWPPVKSPLFSHWASPANAAVQRLWCTRLISRN